MVSRVRELEIALTALRAEKEELAKDKCDALEKLKLQDKELRDALTQRKLAMTEYNEVTERLCELRQQKQKLSRQVRDKEEELEVAMQKIDALRADIRKSDKGRREMEARLETVTHEATMVSHFHFHFDKIDALRADIRKSDKGRREMEARLETVTHEASMVSHFHFHFDKIDALRADIRKSDKGRREMEARLETVTHEATMERKLREEALRSARESGAPAGAADVARLQAEVDALEHQYKESLSQQQSRYNAEMASLRDQLQEADAMRTQLNRELQTTKEKLESRRMEQMNDSDDKQMLINENRKLAKDLEAMAENGRRWQAERRQLDTRLEELRAKRDTTTHWEAQIADIIRWVADEKEARGYLQALATKMTEELDYLKHASTPRSSLPSPSPATAGNNGGGGGWRNRRSQKLDKMEILTLQSSLHSEIQAKQAVGEELSRTRSELLASQR
ncbi:hypothetical protein JYU34_022642 [Plutella xylostella]|uniref:KELK-motif containing domain-containing protein n=1 Tax=Plutella xylostella TaxID=51655 RepID=A0ABQ7PPR1_PLUXY|nr:hypothetical protein JYU34_022642 [Plutella xylostella]